MKWNRIQVDEVNQFVLVGFLLFYLLLQTKMHLLRSSHNSLVFRSQTEKVKEG